MVAISSLKCLVTPIMIINIIFGISYIIIRIKYTNIITIINGGFFIVAGIFGLLG